MEPTPRVRFGACVGEATTWKRLYFAFLERRGEAGLVPLVPSASARTQVRSTLFVQSMASLNLAFEHALWTSLNLAFEHALWARLQLALACCGQSATSPNLVHE